ncbi:MAG: aminotransferase [Cyclobacteriaceae bacterium]|nr:MAG: aminotransferase [Cyclobacteriaceae bacterium]
MKRKIYFTPGPSALYFTVEEHLRTAFKNQIPSISHRGEEFSNIYRDTDKNLRELLSLPEDYCVFFTGSATEVWERMLQSSVRSESLHLVNGAFSRRFSNIAGQLDLNPRVVEVPPGQIVTVDQLPDNYEPELVGVTHNETSTGAMQPLEDIRAIREKYPEALIAVDVVSSLPVVPLPFDIVDSAYFSVQKCFGLPSGLGVWLVNNKFIEKARHITGRSSYHGIDSFLSNYRKYQTPATPNVLSIYLLGKVVGDMLEKGLDRIRMETRYKSAILYHLLESKVELTPFVEHQAWRSETIIVAKGKQTGSLAEALAQKGLVVGRGYGEFKNDHIRIANFPTHSKEQIEMLADQIDGMVN